MIYAFLSGMYVFHWKGMCSSAVSNAPNGTALYCSAGISAALHIHSLAVTGTQDSAHQALSLRVVMLSTRGRGTKEVTWEGLWALDGPSCLSSKEEGDLFCFPSSPHVVASLGRPVPAEASSLELPSHVFWHHRCLLEMAPASTQGD